MLIIEPHPLTRAGLIQLFGNEPDFEIIAAVGTSEEGRAAILRFTVDFVILGTALPVENWLALLTEIHHAQRSLPILVLSLHDGAFFAERALRAGARGFITKSEDGADVLSAARAVLGGAIYKSERASRLA